MKLYKSKTWLHYHFNLRGESIAQIAKICGVTEMTIRRYLEKHQLIRKPK